MCFLNHFRAHSVRTWRGRFGRILVVIANALLTDCVIVATHIVAAAWTNVAKNLSDKLRQAYQLLSDGAEIIAVAEQIGLAENTVYVYRQRVEKLICKEIIRLEDQLG